MTVVGIAAELSDGVSSSSSASSSGSSSAASLDSLADGAGADATAGATAPVSPSSPRRHTTRVASPRRATGRTTISTPTRKKLLTPGGSGFAGFADYEPPEIYELDKTPNESWLRRRKREELGNFTRWVRLRDQYHASILTPDEEAQLRDLLYEVGGGVGGRTIDELKARERSHEVSVPGLPRGRPHDGVVTAMHATRVRCACVPLDALDENSLERTHGDAAAARQSADRFTTTVTSNLLEGMAAAAAATDRERSDIIAYLQKGHEGLDLERLEGRRASRGSTDSGDTTTTDERSEGSNESGAGASDAESFSCNGPAMNQASSFERRSAQQQQQQRAAPRERRCLVHGRAIA